MSEQTPATPASAADPGATPPKEQAASEKKVEVSESELAKLQRDAARAAEAQSRADRLERQAQRRKTVSEPEPFTDKEKAEITGRVSNLLLGNAEYGKLVQNNPALRKVLLGKNPLSLLDADNFVDIEDAIDQLEDYLSAEVSRVAGNSGAGQTPRSESDAPKVPTPPPVNPKVAASPVKTDVEKKQEELDKIPGMAGIEARLASRVNVK